MERFGSRPLQKKTEETEDESEVRVFIFSYLRAGHAMVRTPAIFDGKSVCCADQKELVTFITVNCTLQDRGKLNLSSMSKVDLLRHALAIATTSAAAAAGSKKVSIATQLCLTPYASCSIDELLMMAVERHLLPPSTSTTGSKNKVKLSRDQLLLLVASRSTPLQHQPIIVNSLESEKCRRAVTERCLGVIQERFEWARYEEECKRFLDWAKRDALAHKDAAMLLNRIKWLDDLVGNIPFAGEIAKYLARHIVPFLIARPDLILSEHCSWKVLGIARALQHSGGIAKMDEREQLLSSSTELGFFGRVGKYDASQLREPQRLALEALRDSVLSSNKKKMPFHSDEKDDKQSEEDEEEDSDRTEEEEQSLPPPLPPLPTAAGSTLPTDDLATEYDSLIALRRWFARVLEASFSRDAQLLVPLQEGERIFAAFGIIKAQLSELPRMVVLPTGIGKSGVLCLTPFCFIQAEQQQKQLRVLVICPSVEIRQQMAASFTTFYTQRVGVSAAPKVTEICGSGWRWDQCKDYDVFVGTFHRFGGNRLLTDFPRLLFDLVLVDEAHHAEALMYRMLREHFCKAQFVYFTGTPYRSDHQMIRAELVYSCTMREALERETPYIKRLCYLPLPVKSLTLIGPSTQRDTSSDQQQQEQNRKSFGSFEEVVENAREISKALVRSTEAESHVIGFIIWKLREMRRNGSGAIHHQAILQAADTSDAASLVHLWNAHPENCSPRGGGGEPVLTISAVHSQMARDECAAVIERLKKHTLDAIVHVGMIGEGFDHPHLSICGIFRRFASMPPFVQLVGRALRRIPNCTNELDNVGFVIAHPGLGLHKHWDLYKREVELPDDSDLTLPGTCGNAEWTALEETFSYEDESHADWFVSNANAGK